MQTTMCYSHICALEGEAACIFRTQYHWYQRLCRMRQISVGNPRTVIYFRSLAAVEKERVRHRSLRYNLMIHPLSLLNVYLSAVFAIIFLFALIIFPLHVAFSPYVALFTVKEAIDHCIKFGELPMDFFCFLDVILTFITGRCISVKQGVILNPRIIARLYLTSSGFYFDLLCSIPIYVLLTGLARQFPVLLLNVRLMMIMETVPIIKFVRIIKFHKYLNNTTELMRHHYYTRTAIKFYLLMLIAFHWLICVYIIVGQVMRYPNELSAHSGPTESIFEFKPITIYMKSANIVGSYILNISLANGYRASIYYLPTTAEEIAVFIAYSLLGYITCNILLVVILQTILSMNSSEIKYHAIVSQLDKYMTHKDLSLSMRSRIFTYYEYRYRKKYFREGTISSMLSETLQVEINMYSCRTLIETVNLLKELPPEIVADVVSNLKHEVFLFNDIIVKAGTNGDCMYFIARGTVAVYTPTGKEICHLRDGAYFGEIALLSAEKKRVANVVAIEICEIYRLDKKNFHNCFPANSLHFKKVEQIAHERMEKTSLLEELYKKYILEGTTIRKADEIAKRHNVTQKTKK